MTNAHAIELKKLATWVAKHSLFAGIAASEAADELQRLTDAEAQAVELLKRVAEWKGAEDLGPTLVDVDVFLNARREP